MRGAKVELHCAAGEAPGAPAGVRPAASLGITTKSEHGREAVCIGRRREREPTCCSVFSSVPGGAPPTKSLFSGLGELKPGSAPSGASPASCMMSLFFSAPLTP